MCDLFDLGPRFDATSEEQVRKKLAEYEKKRMEDLLLNSDDPAIVEARREAMVVVKLCGWQYYGEDFDKEEKRLRDDLERWHWHCEEQERLMEERKKQAEIAKIAEAAAELIASHEENKLPDPPTKESWWSTKLNWWKKYKRGKKA